MVWLCSGGTQIPFSCSCGCYRARRFSDYNCSKIAKDDHHSTKLGWDCCSLAVAMLARGDWLMTSSDNLDLKISYI